MSLPTHRLVMRIEADHENCVRLGEEFEEWAGAAGAKSQDWEIEPLQKADQPNRCEARRLLRQMLDDMGSESIIVRNAVLDEIIAGAFIRTYTAGLALVTEFFEDAAATIEASTPATGEAQPSDPAAEERRAGCGPGDGGGDQPRGGPGGPG